MPRRRVRRSKEDINRWLISYADFITLLFAFFVVLYAMSTINESKYRVMAETLEAAFSTTPKSLQPIQVGEVSRSPNKAVIETFTQAPAGDGELSNFASMAAQVEQDLAELIQQELVQVNRTEDWLEIEINSEILFASGSAFMGIQSVQVLQRLSRILKSVPNPINVEGFTDNLPINNDQYTSNWELSAARAASVVHLFTREGVQPQRLSAIAYGEFRPKASNDFARGRKQNRRVVIAVLAKDFNMRHTIEAKQTQSVAP
ncbi:MAG: flagellar motor protein MotD [Gammaproteobacteria bacterium]|nr:flagellar motor protein MotD [Gammaproteobacteria bacterium]MDH5730191.1 flagellar motor protein MotD [Gammaproteobacteria bacterium]